MAASTNKTRAFYWLLVATGIYVLLPFFLIAQYNQPSADDYSGAVRDAHQTFSAVFWDTYLHWSGRYFATLVARINPLLFHSLVAYRWYAVLLIVAFVAALFVLIRVLIAEFFTRLQSLALCCLLLFLYFTVLPGTAEGFYWFSGAYIYQTANIFNMVLVAAVVKLQRSSSSPERALYFLMAAVAGLAAIGCNEISLIITCCFTTGLAVNKYYSIKKHDKLLWLLVMIFILAACASVFAPGNFLRMDDWQEYSKSPLWAIAGAGGITVIYITQWAVPLLIATVLYMLFFGNVIAAKMGEQGRSAGIKPLHSIAFSIVLFLLLQLFTVWVAGGSNLGRIENVIYLYFLLAWFFNVQLLMNKYYSRQKPLSVFAKPMLVIVTALFLMNVFDINNNISTAYVDVLSGKAKRYDEQLNERLLYVKNCKADTCLVPPLNDLPKTIFFTDIKCTTDTIDFWMNKAYSGYAGKGYVLVNAPLPGIKTNMESIRDFGRQTRSGIFEGQK
jgi:hypothetical protein